VVGRPWSVVCCREPPTRCPLAPGTCSSPPTSYPYVVGSRWYVGGSPLTTYDIPSTSFVFSNIPAFCQHLLCFHTHSRFACGLPSPVLCFQQHSRVGRSFSKNYFSLSHPRTDLLSTLPEVTRRLTIHFTILNSQENWPLSLPSVTCPCFSPTCHPRPTAYQERGIAA